MQERCLEGDRYDILFSNKITATTRGTLSFKGELRYVTPRPYFWHEIRLSTHREQFGEGRRPSKAI